MATYGKKASAAVGEALHEEKRGRLKSGKSGDAVTSREQAIAIGLSKARKAGAKVPDKPAGAGKAADATKTDSKKVASKKVASKKAVSKKAAARKAS